MKTISHLFRNVGLIRLLAYTNRLRLDPETSVVIRRAGMSPPGLDSFAILFKKDGEKRATAALFVHWNIEQEQAVPYAFVQPELGICLRLFRTNSRGWSVGVREALRPRLESIMQNWDSEIMQALNLKRSIVPVVHLAAGA